MNTFKPQYSELKHLAILNIELYAITDTYLCELKKNQKINQNIFDYLPEFAINKDYGNILNADYYHQFSGFEDKGEKFLFLNASTFDHSLNLDFENMGIEDVFENVDFRNILNKFKPNDDETIKNFVIPKTENVIIEIKYWGGKDYMNGDYDFDVEYKIIGYLDDDMNKILI